MENMNNILLWTVIILLLQQVFCNNTRCTSYCLKCSPKGCIKCPNLIVFPSRQCVNTCPYGHNQHWSTFADYMGRICVHNGNFLGFTSGFLTISAGILIGALLSFLVITCALIYVKHKRNLPPILNIDNNSDIIDDERRQDFLKQLETLRPYSHDYLDMLNDTRRQLRESYRDGDNGAFVAYRPVLRDLAKILLLLNRPIDNIYVPDDWETLFNWAEKALKRYKRMSDISQPQVAQLINFLQTPTEQQQQQQRNSSNSTTTIMSTFKPNQQMFDSTLSLQNVAINNFNSNYDLTLNPQWKFEYNAMLSTNSEFNPLQWKNSKEYLNSSSLFLDDDFCQLGLRPQDEITTEL